MGFAETMLKPATWILNDNQWHGQPCFIIGGGPSLKTFDFSLLSGRNTIGVNMAFRHDPTIAYIGDQDLMEKIEDDPESGWCECKSIKLVRKVLEDWRVPGTGRMFNLAGCYGIDVSPWQVTWPRTLEESLMLVNNNGLVALQIADLLGADPIYLLGFDMRSDESGDSNWHDYYKGWKGQTRDSGFYTFLEIWRLSVPERVCKKVVNVGLDSRLELFKKISFGALKAQLDGDAAQPQGTSGKIKVRLKHAGHAKPLPIDDAEVMVDP